VPHGARYLLRNGRGAALGEGQSLVACEWLAVSDTGDQGAEARIFHAAPLEREQIEALFGEQIEPIDEVRWNAGAGRVEATRRHRLGALVLSEAPLPNPDPDALTTALLEGVRSTALRALPWGKSTRQLQQRLQFMHHADPDTWPDVGDERLLAALPEWLGPFVRGMRRLDELARLDLHDVLWTHAGWQLRPVLDELAPTHLEVPSGSRIPLDYTDPGAPALAVRLQEVFGWRETPRIGGGRVPVTMRLLSPAQRPVQVTTDLASFWRDGYFEVRKELRGRYPKHYWPEDPLVAEPTRRARPKGG
jgi:ATP-dependent helicase HrpB